MMSASKWRPSVYEGSSDICLDAMFATGPTINRLGRK
jgi:hypothetical protein